MAIIVTLRDFVPIPRYDGNDPFTQARIEEAAASVGPWTILETIVLSPVDTNPAEPLPRDLTTDLATLQNGWYRIVWVDANGDTSTSEPVQNIMGPEQVAYLPTLRDVALPIYSRTKDNLGNYLGTFNDNTRPKASQVLGLIRQATSDVTAKIDYDIPEEMYDQVRDLIALGAALRIELSFYGEQVGSDKSPYDELKDLYDEGLERINTALMREQAEVITGDESGSGMVAFNFPEAEALWTKRF